MNITPKRREILQRIHDAPGELVHGIFTLGERRQATMMASAGLISYTENYCLILTDAGRQALHDAGDG